MKAAMENRVFPSLDHVVLLPQSEALQWSSTFAAINDSELADLGTSERMTMPKHDHYSLDKRRMFRVFANEAATSSSVALERAIQSAHDLAQIRHPLKQIFFSWPNLREASERLAATVSSVYPDIQSDSTLPPNSLVAMTLVRATQAFVKARTQHEDEMAPPQAFLEALLDASVSIAGYDVHGLGNGDSRRWEMGTEALTVFSGRFKELAFAPVVPKPREIIGCRLMLISKTLTVEDTSFLKLETVDRRPLLEKAAKAASNVYSLAGSPATVN